MEDNKDNNIEKSEVKSEGKAGGKTMAEKAIDRFAQMMVTRLEEMKGQQWEKGWIDGGGKNQGLPQNLSGRRYSGHNDFFLQLHTAMKGYDVPVYATYKQLKDAGGRSHYVLSIFGQRGSGACLGSYRQHLSSLFPTAGLSSPPVV